MALAIYAPAQCSWSARGGGRGHSQLAAGSSSDPDPPGNGGCTVLVLFGRGVAPTLANTLGREFMTAFFSCRYALFRPST